MKTYLTMVISGAILATIFQTASPEKWKKYINVITGVMIVSIILTPLLEFKKVDLFADYGYIKMPDKDIHKNLVCDELEKRVSEDASSRLEEKINKKLKVKTVLSVNKNMEITGIKEMTVWSSVKKQEIAALLMEVYSPEKIYFR